MTTINLKRRAGYGKGGFKGFDQVMPDLQMQPYVCIRSFDQRLSKQGVPYGWNVTRYIRPERQISENEMDAAYSEAPDRAFARMCDHLQSILPDVSRSAIEHWLK